MKRGDVVRVTLLGGQQVERKVWEPLERGALICTSEAYDEALLSGEEPPTVGFRPEFIEPVGTARRA